MRERITVEGLRRHRRWVRRHIHKLRCRPCLRRTDKPRCRGMVRPDKTCNKVVMDHRDKHPCRRDIPAPCSKRRPWADIRDNNRPWRNSSRRKNRKCIRRRSPSSSFWESSSSHSVDACRACAWPAPVTHQTRPSNQQRFDSSCDTFGVSQPLDQAMATIAKFRILDRESTAYPTGLPCVANEYARRS